MAGGYGDLVSRYRVAAGLTQEELAVRAGLGVRTVRDIERGRTRRPHPGSADRLARALARDELAWDVVRDHLPRRSQARIPPQRASEGVHHDGDAPPPPPAVPRQLPGRARHFTGRADELAGLSRLLSQAAAERPGAVVISAIGGTAGVGKTELAVHWAHQVAGNFPDGQLHVNLRGYDPAHPVPAKDALAGFLRALGVPSQDIPLTEAERAAQYRSLLAGRRMLVLLDNARCEEQVRPLLPGTSSCLTLVTSRDALAGLVARDGAARLELDLMPPDAAADLLRALIGDRASADPAATATLAEQCCRLPLALRVAAELATARPAACLADLLAELANQQRRLDLLDANGDSKTAVRAVFSWSYRHLSTEGARAFRLIGLHPGPDLDGYALAALAGCPAGQADHALGQLARAHLIRLAQPGRYGMHDLLRGYARELAAAQDGPEVTRAALTRLFGHYLRTAMAAMEACYLPDYRDKRLHWTPGPGPGIPTPPLTDPAAARAWLDGHRASLVAAVTHAADGGWPEHAAALAATLFRYLDSSGHFPEAITIHTCARRAAQQAGHRAAEAEALTSLAVTDWRQGRHQQATRQLRQALTAFRELGDQTGQIRALGNLSVVSLRQGRLQKATRQLQQILALASKLGDPMSEARALASLGEIDLRQGRHEQGARHLRQALARYHQVGHDIGVAAALTWLGEIDLRQGRHSRAVRRCRQALATFRAAGDRDNEARALTGLGHALLGQGSHDQAVRYLRRALALYAQIIDRSAEAQTLSLLGDVFLATGQTDDACAQYTAALGLAGRAGDRYQQARAHQGLGHACHTAGHSARARRHWQHALRLYTSLATPETEQVRACLSALAP